MIRSGCIPDVACNYDFGCHLQKRHGVDRGCGVVGPPPVAGKSAAGMDRAVRVEGWCHHFNHGGARPCRPGENPLVPTGGYGEELLRSGCGGRRDPCGISRGKRGQLVDKSTDSRHRVDDWNHYRGRPVSRCSRGAADRSRDLILVHSVSAGMMRCRPSSGGKSRFKAFRTA